ncbi:MULTISPECIES: ATP-binding protein [unclassified Cryobacterium]|uniref:ATP-binding protein n=1 Tax=unclassified Cryobacterium TaxID=2649013 RepID=UPI002B23B85D|nr:MULTISPECIES: ATP-binding protein [unclassified Cryobacterium]MEB0001005.1 ATP-binding protein [Cryobacterium sp. RTS3]MEB0267867.1 ATP-binding protein [Cryobacterium sp. 10I5]
MTDTNTAPTAAATPAAATPDAADAASDTASSVDGREFRLQCGQDSPLLPGQYVELDDPSGRVFLGQVDVLTASDGGFTGTGWILGVVDAGGRLDPRGATAFTRASVSTAGPDLVELLHEASGATLTVGALLASPGVPARLLPHRFNRHTFWCGQSGSGKTYALGVLIEQLLAHTELPIVIFDPNADFVRLGEVRADAAPGEADALRNRDIRVLRPGSGPGEHLRVRFRSLPLPVKAAMLRLDPLRDRAEYNSVLHLNAFEAENDPGALLARLRESPDPAHQALALRIENLGVLDWNIYAFDEPAATEIIDARPHATVLDLGGFEHADEPLVTALSVLENLWAHREERRPVLLVIDEAHNLCSPDQNGPLHTALREQIIQIAAEGRKFGLWLLLSTQRPSKIHPGIISQCDNLALMKMSSPADLAELAALFGYAPAALLAQSPRFRQGEALFAGGFVPAPSLVRVRDRITEEGGIDVKVPLR